MSLSNAVEETTQRKHLQLLDLEKKTLERDIATVRSQIQALMAAIQAAAQHGDDISGEDGDMEIDDHVNEDMSDAAAAGDELDSEIWEIICGPDVQVRQTNRPHLQEDECMNENEDEDDLEIYEDDMDEEEIATDEISEMDEEWMVVDTLVDNVVDDVVDTVEQDEMDDIEQSYPEEYDMMDDDESNCSLEEGEIRET